MHKQVLGDRVLGRVGPARRAEDGRPPVGQLLVRPGEGDVARLAETRVREVEGGELPVLGRVLLDVPGEGLGDLDGLARRHLEQLGGECDAGSGGVGAAPSLAG